METAGKGTDCFSGVVPATLQPVLSSINRAVRVLGILVPANPPVWHFSFLLGGFVVGFPFNPHKLLAGDQKTDSPA